MSHVATVDVEIKDLDALAAACRRCGLELVRDQHEFVYWNGHKQPCAHAIRLAGQSAHADHEIGVCAREDGRPGFALAWDPSMSRRRVQAGKNCNSLKQAYATEVARRYAQASGQRVTERVLPNGKIRLELTKV